MAHPAVGAVVKELVDGRVGRHHCDRGVAHQQNGIEKGRNRNRRHRHYRKGRRVYETLLCSSGLGRVVVGDVSGRDSRRDHNGDALKEGIVVGGIVPLGGATLLCYYQVCGSFMDSVNGNFGGMMGWPGSDRGMCGCF